MNLTEKIQFLVALINEFAQRHGITDAEAAKYMNRYGAIALCEKHYGYLHTQSFESNVSDVTTFCRRKGGKL